MQNPNVAKQIWHQENIGQQEPVDLVSISEVNVQIQQKIH